MTTLALLGSSRAGGETARLLAAVLDHLDDSEMIDLSALAIGPYSYTNAHQGDDFLPLAQRMLKAHTLILASPVYWYAMSAQMKAFFDRLTDLTDPPYKVLGKQLAGKAIFTVATGGSPSAPASFVSPFEDTAGYFNMQWGGMLYRPGRDALSTDDLNAARDFAQIISRLPSD